MTIYSSLVTFFVKDDCGMTGSIPIELTELHDLIYIDLSSNQLSGEVPSELSKLSNLGKYAIEEFFLRRV